MSTYEDILNLSLDGYTNDASEEAISVHLTFIGEIELAGVSWEFDLLRFYVRPETGAILYANDSGCSCPCPFEGTLVSDLKETSLKRVRDIVINYVYEDDEWYISKAEVLARLQDMLPRMKAAGAK